MPAQKPLSERVQPSIVHFTATATANAKSSRWQDALLTFVTSACQGLQADVVIVSAVLNACSRGVQWQFANGVAGSMAFSSIEPNVVTCSTLVSACSDHEKGRWRRALDIFQHTLIGSILPNMFIYSGALAACQKGKDWEGGLYTFNDVKRRSGFAVDVVMYNAVSTACSQAGKWQLFSTLWHELRETRLRPTIISYNAALSAESELGQRWQHGLEIASAMTRDSVNMDQVTHNSMCKSLATGRAWCDVLTLVHYMQCTRIRSDTITFNIVALACGAACTWQACVSLLGVVAIQSFLPDAVTFSAILGATSAAWEITIALLSDVLRLRMSLDIAGYNVAIAACRGSSRWKEGLHISSSLPRLSLVPDAITVNSLMAMVERARLWDVALVLLPSFERLHDVVALNTAISACEKAGRWIWALDLLSHMKAQAMDPDVISYNACISACEKSSQWIMALALLCEMQHLRLVPDVVSFSSVLSACEKSDQWHRAFHVLKFMRDSACIPNSFTYNAAISACSGGARWAMALALATSATDAGFLPDVVTIGSLANALDAGCQWARSLAKLEELPNVVAPVFNAALSACCAALRWATVLGLLSSLQVQRKEPDVTAYTFASEACYAAAAEEALPLLARVEDKAVASLQPSCLQRSRDW